MEPDELFAKYLDSQRKVYVSTSNRASQVGHPCERALVYQRTAWQQALLPERRLQGIFLFGWDYERALRRRLEDAGILLRQPSRPATWPEFELSGTDDGDISCDQGETWKMVEIKGLHTYYFDRVDNWRSFLDMGPIYVKYPAQVQIYMLLNGIEDSLFVIGRKGAYDVKFLPVELDYAYAETILKKLERVNAHVKSGTLPEKLNDVDCCEICEFRFHCCPELPYGKGYWLTHEEEAVQLMREHETLAAAKSEAVSAYDRVHEQVKQMVADTSLALIGTYQVKQKPDKRGAIRMTIKNLGAGDEGTESE